jgi:excisionase family DNA binding protein
MSPPPEFRRVSHSPTIGSGDRAIGVADHPAELLTMEEAAQHLRVGEKTIYNLRRRGLLASIKLGDDRNSAVRIQRGDLDAYIARSRRVATTGGNR